MEITTDYRKKNTEEEKGVIESWHYRKPKGDQGARYNLINESTQHLASMLLEICPPSVDRTEAIKSLRIVRMQANASIACNE